MDNKTFTQEYYVIERDGKFYGIEYEDGKCTCNGFIEPYEDGEYEVCVPMEKVRRLTQRSKDYADEHGMGGLTYEGNKEHFLREINGSKLRKVKVTTTIEFVD